MCREQYQPPSVLGTWRCLFPAYKSGVTLFYRHHGLSPGATKGDGGGKWVNSVRISNADIFQPSPADTLPAHCCWGCSRVPGVRAGRGHAASPPQTLSATVSHCSAGPWGSAMSPGREDCLGSQAPGDGRAGSPPLHSRDTQHVLKTGTPLSWPRVQGVGCSFEGTKSCGEGGDPGEAKQFSRL